MEISAREFLSQERLTGRILGREPLSRAGFNKGAWHIAKKNKYPDLLQKCSVYRLGEISASNNFEMRHFVAGAVFAIKDCRAHSLLSGRELGEKSRATKPLEQFDILYNSISGYFGYKHEGAVPTELQAWYSSKGAVFWCF